MEDTRLLKIVTEFPKPALGEVNQGWWDCCSMLFFYWLLTLKFPLSNNTSNAEKLSKFFLASIFKWIIHLVRRQNFPKNWHFLSPDTHATSNRDFLGSCNSESMPLTLEWKTSYSFRYISINMLDVAALQQHSSNLFCSVSKFQ